jgi:hypothetical protein
MSRERGDYLQYVEENRAKDIAQAGQREVVVFNCHSPKNLLNRCIDLQTLADQGQPVVDALLETEQELYQAVEDRVDEEISDTRKMGWNDFWNMVYQASRWQEQLEKVGT